MKVATFPILAVFITGALHAQGPLTPPGPPGPTQKSLQEIWDKLQSAESMISLQQQQISILQQQNSALLEVGGANLPWQILKVEGAVFQNGDPSLAFSPQGAPAVAYVGVGNGSVHFAIQTAGGWLVRQVDGPEQAFWSPSLEFDTAGMPAVAYYSDGLVDMEEDEGLRIARWNGTSWTRTLVALIDGGNNTSCDLEISPNGTLTIAYEDSALNALRLATFVNGSWETETVTTNFEDGRRPSLAFRSDGVPAIAFQDPGDDHANGVYFAFKEGPTWTIETIVEESPDPEGSEDFGSPSLAFAPDGRAAITYDSYTSGAELIYSSRDRPDDWTQSVVTTASDWGFKSTLAFTPSGAPSVGYLIDADAEESTSSICYAVLRGGTWHHERAGRIDFNNFESSSNMAIGPNGQPVIAFYHPDDNTVSIAMRGIFTSR